MSSRERNASPHRGQGPAGQHAKESLFIARRRAIRRAFWHVVDPGRQRAEVLQSVSDARIATPGTR